MNCTVVEPKKKRFNHKFCKSAARDFFKPFLVAREAKATKTTRAIETI